MRIPRRYLKVSALLAVLSLALAACAGGDESPDADEETAAQAEDGDDSASDDSDGGDEKFVIGYDAYWLGNSWSVQLEAEFKAAAERRQDQIEEVIYTSSDNDVQSQISNVQSLISRDVDAILLTPINPSAVVPVIEQAEEAGIRVILVASPADTDAYTAIVNVDDVAFGRTGAEWLVEQLDGEGDLYALNGLAGIPASEQRWEGAQEVFSEYPDINVVAEANADWDQATAKSTVADMLAAHPDVDGVWSQGGSMTLGAIEAFEVAGQELVPMTSEDSNGFLKKWAEEQGNTNFDSLAVSKPTWLSAEGLDVALAALNGEDFDKETILEPPVITSSELDEYVRTDLPDSFWSNTKMSDEQIRELFPDN